MFALRPPDEPFLEADVELDPARVTTPYAFLGIPYGPPYEPQDLTLCAGAADAVRSMAHRMEYRALSGHHNFDWGGPLYPDGASTVTDCGNVEGDPAEPRAIWGRGLDVMRALVAGGVTPLVLGGLDAIPPIVVGGFDEPLHVLHIDSHLDFRQEVNGETHGYSSPIRRIRELSHVGRIVQVGLRGMGSARPSDVEDAVDSGNELITAREVHEGGIDRVAERLTPDRRWVITIDCDGLDPTIAPAVGWPEPGGLTYVQVATLIRTLAERDLVASLVITEFQPDLDVTGITAMHIVRLLVLVIGIQRRPFPTRSAIG